jgi:hypothetical protein
VRSKREPFRRREVSDSQEGLQHSGPAARHLGEGTTEDIWLVSKQIGRPETGRRVQSPLIRTCRFDMSKVVPVAETNE